MEHQHKILSVNQNFPTFELTFDIQRLRVYGARLEFNWDGENVGKAYYKDFEILTEGSETILLMKQQIAACELKWQNINNIIDQEITAQIQEGGIIYNFVEEHGGGGSDKLLYEAVGYDTLNEKVLVTEGEQTLQQRLGEKLNSLESEKYPTSGITTTADLPADFVFTGENTMELMSIEVIKNPIDLDGITVWQTALPSLVSVSKETSETFVSPFVNGPQTFAGALPNLKNGDTFLSSPHLVSFCTKLPSLEYGYDMFIHSENLVSVDTELPLLSDGRQMFAETGIYSFDINLPSLLSGKQMFRDCKNLQSFTGNTPLLEEAEGMFTNCAELTEFKYMLPRLKNSKNMFKSCDFQEWKVALPQLITADGMFQQNKNLTTFQLGTDKKHANAMGTLESANAMFQNCNLTTWEIDMPVLENGDNMFNSNKNLTTFQLGANGSFANEITTLTTANGMFRNCNLSTWKIDMPALQSANYMFASNTSLSKFQLGTDSSHANTLSNLTSAIGMFMNCNLTSWDIELPALVNAGNTTWNSKGNKQPDGMFSGNKITSWNIELPNLENGNGMFQGNKLTEWNIDLPNMKYGGTMFMDNKNLRSFTANTSKLEEGRHYVAGSGYWGMFQGCTSLEEFVKTNEGGVEKNSLKKASETQYMFAGCSALKTFQTDTFDGDDWMESRYWFNGCSNLESVIFTNDNHEHGMSNIRDCWHLFDGCRNLKTWKCTSKEREQEEQGNFYEEGTFHYKFMGSLSKADGAGNMFQNCLKLTKFVIKDMSLLKGNNGCTGATSMFNGCSNLTLFCCEKIGSKNGCYPTLNDMFSYCSSLQFVKENENDENNAINLTFATTTANMFNGCTSLRSIGLKSTEGETPHLANTNSMFLNCRSLESVSIGNTVLSKTTTATGMFNGCSALSSITLGEDAFASLSNASDMFAGCTAITKEIILSVLSNLPTYTSGSHTIGIIDKFDESTKEEMVNSFGDKGWRVAWI